MDMVMLTFPEGRNEPKRSMRRFFASSGFRLESVVPTASAVSVVEAVPI
jgi:hypothetical protein